MTKFNSSCHDINSKSHYLIQDDANENEACNAIVVYKYSQNKASNDYEKNDNNIVKDIVHIEIDKDVDLVEET